MANESMDNIRSAARSGENLFPHVIQAIKNDCTLGEIMEAMKDVFGTWMAPSGF
jgi:methylmalonyl-CoA mutase N-terminal domain/subunit